MKSIERDIASAIIISADQQILMGQKDPNSGSVYGDGVWVIPGGGVEPGETIEQAAIREVLEEVALDITPYALDLVDDASTHAAIKTLTSGEQVEVQMRFFTYRIELKVKAAEIPVKPSEELIVVKWVPLTDLKSYPVTPPSTRLFKRLGLLT